MRQIVWLTLKELYEKLALYPPIGLSLRDFFHARTEIDPSNWFGRAPESIPEQGLGTLRVFCGLYNSEPFAISAISWPPTQWGFEVRLPDRLTGDHLSVELLAAIGLPLWSRPFFLTLPISSGFSVLEIGQSDPIYASPDREEAETVAKLLNAVEPGRYTVSPLLGDNSSWIVTGPVSGPYYSRVEIMGDEKSALRHAEAETRRTGFEFVASRAAQGAVRKQPNC